MTSTRAITLAIAALEAQIKRLATNANLADLYHADAPACVEASRRRAELREAVRALREPRQARMKL
jgi:hypothetical protein